MKKLSIEERCKLFVRWAGSENGWLLNVIFKFLQYQKSRVSHNEITGSTLRNYVKVLKLFCEMNSPEGCPGLRIMQMIEFLLLKRSEK
jgi:S-adenosylmethionine:diacylglycerol 3-amino-3-carboxypropyl transferase